MVAHVKTPPKRYPARGTDAVDDGTLDWFAQEVRTKPRSQRMIWWGVTPSLVTKAIIFTAIVVLGAGIVWWAMPRPEPVPVPEGFFEEPYRLVEPDDRDPNTQAGSPSLPEGSSQVAETELFLHVAGEVVAPGLISLPPGSRVADALTRAGGPLPEANLSAINLAAKVNDGEQILVPRLGDPVSAVALGPGGGLVNINSATAAELQELPGIGPVMADRILEFRASHGPFQVIDDLQSVPGIGPAIMGQIREVITL